MRFEHLVSWQGAREKQLDRFQIVETGSCTLFMMADGFACCETSPHYVDWLTAELGRLNASSQDAPSVCAEINRLLCMQSGVAGKASVAFVVSDTCRYQYATLGDTRIYWLSARERTRDHSLAERCVAQGWCPPERLRHHALRNSLTAYAQGVSKVPVMPVWSARPYRHEERLLLCTDGFWSLFDDNDIYAISCTQALQSLLARAWASDAYTITDNLTVALLSRGMPFTGIHSG